MKASDFSFPLVPVLLGEPSLNCRQGEKRQRKNKTKNKVMFNI